MLNGMVTSNPVPHHAQISGIARYRILWHHPPVSPTVAFGLESVADGGLITLSLWYPCYLLLHPAHLGTQHNTFQCVWQESRRSSPAWMLMKG